MSEQVRTLTPATFLITKEVRRFTEFCDACRRYRYIGLCYGPSGVGKSLSARHYARWHVVEPRIVPDPFAEETPTPPELANCRSILYTPSVAMSPKRLGEQIDQLCRALSWAQVRRARHRPGGPQRVLPGLRRRLPAGQPALGRAGAARPPTVAAGGRRPAATVSRSRPMSIARKKIGIFRGAHFPRVRRTRRRPSSFPSAHKLCAGRFGLVGTARAFRAVAHGISGAAGVSGDEPD
jgi:hypothetical protein